LSHDRKYQSPGNGERIKLKDYLYKVHVTSQEKKSNGSILSREKGNNATSHHFASPPIDKKKILSKNSIKSDSR
jgi:hypothetical protein